MIDALMLFIASNFLKILFCYFISVLIWIVTITFINGFLTGEVLSEEDFKIALIWPLFIVFVLGLSLNYLVTIIKQHKQSKPQK